MALVFLSHSSYDKDFVRVISNELGDLAFIDERSVEAGLRTMDELASGIADAKVFVALLSSSALDSQWVQKELEMAIKYCERNELEILTFSIDKNVNHHDKRIPLVLRQGYNIRKLTNPQIILSCINDRIKYLRQKESPVNSKVSNLFIGRGELLKHFDEDFANLDNKVPNFVVAANYYSGIGRKTFLKKALENHAFLKPTHSPVEITMSQGESVENFILKLNTFLWNKDIDALDFSKVSLEKKISIAASLLLEYKNNCRLLIILDEGAIVLPNHEIVGWFTKMMDTPEFNNRLTVGIVSKWEPYPKWLGLGNSFGKAYSVQELDNSETTSLFVKLLDIYGIRNLEAQEKKNFISVLTGIPSQVIFTVRQIQALGPLRAFQLADDIKMHSDRYSSALFEEIKKNELATRIALILTKEALSLDVIFELFGHGQNTVDALVFLQDFSAIIYINSGKKIVKLNTALSDYIKRRKIEPNKNDLLKFDTIIKGYLQQSLDYLVKEDYSKFLLSLSKCMEEKKTIPQKYYIAPLFISNILNAYKEGKYDDVEKFCEVFLRNRNLDDQVVWELKYHRVKVYARTSNEQKFWTALHDIKLSEIDKEFLIGFYYRNSRNHLEIEKALEHFNNVLNVNPGHQRSKREIVNTYILLEEYNSALKLAEENHKNNPEDLLHLQSYFIVLIRHSDFDKSTQKIDIESLIERANEMSDPRVDDVVRCMEGEKAYYVDDNIEKAEKILQEATRINKNKRFPLKSLLAIYKKDCNFDKVREMRTALSKI